jgi:hypothetical protein
MLRTLHTLRRSVAAGRPMSLPNCVRLCRRELAESVAPGAEQRAAIDTVISLYLRHQPFRSGPHVLRLTEDRP